MKKQIPVQVVAAVIECGGWVLNAGTMTLLIDFCSWNSHYKVMKILPAALMTICLLLATASKPDAACNECHSKNPKMRKMHEALGYRDCFKCHGFGRVKKAPEEYAAQMATDPLCIDCHKK